MELTEPRFSSTDKISKMVDFSKGAALETQVNLI